MGEMTLDEVSAALRNNADGLVRMDEHPILANRLRKLADAIDAHLTQPAQAVDVGKVRATMEYLRSFRGVTPPNWDHMDFAANLLTAALPKDSNGAEGM